MHNLRIQRVLFEIKILVSVPSWNDKFDRMIFQKGLSPIIFEFGNEFIIYGLALVNDIHVQHARSF